MKVILVVWSSRSRSPYKTNIIINFLALRAATLKSMKSVILNKNLNTKHLHVIANK